LRDRSAVLAKAVAVAGSASRPALSPRRSARTNIAAAAGGCMKLPTRVSREPTPKYDPDDLPVTSVMLEINVFETIRSSP
jgi:hypothetical protein